MVRFDETFLVSLFKKDTKEYFLQLKHIGGPLLLAVHGRGAFVVDHINSYIRLAKLAKAAQQDKVLQTLLDRVD